MSWVCPCLALSFTRVRQKLTLKQRIENAHKCCIQFFFVFLHLPCVGNTFLLLVEIVQPLCRKRNCHTNRFTCAVFSQTIYSWGAECNLQPGRLGVGVLVDVAAFFSSVLVLAPFGSLHVRCKRTNEGKKKNPAKPSNKYLTKSHVSISICLNCLGSTLV